MPQTLLGLLGIVLASVLSLQQVRAGMDTKEKLRDSEVQTLATSVAMGVLNELESRPFDEGVKDAFASSPAELTPMLGGGFFHPGGDAADDDLDDVHGSSETTVHVLRDGRTGIRLQTDAEVGYVSEADGETVAVTPTRFKRVTVTVRSLDVSAPTVSISQVYSCGSYCAW